MIQLHKNTVFSWHIYTKPSRICFQGTGIDTCFALPFAAAHWRPNQSRLEQPRGSSLISTLSLMTRIASSSDCTRGFQNRAYRRCDILRSANAQVKACLIRVCVRSEGCSHLWRSAGVSRPWTASAMSRSATGTGKTPYGFLTGTEGTEDLVKHMNHVCIPSCVFKECECCT